MQEWEKRVKPVPWEWLLEESNPSARYFTLCQLLDLSIDSKEVISACERIMQIGPALKILAKQHPDGYWGKSVNYYVNAKYKGTAHTMLILAQLGVSQEDKRIKHMCEFILDVAQDPISGGFSCSSSSTGHGDQRNLEPCFTGNMTWALIQLGYLADPRVKKALDWITTYMRFDDGDSRPLRIFPYYKKDNCWGKHTCHAAVIRTTKAVAATPKQYRSQEMERMAKQAANHLLKHQIFRKSHDLSQIAKPVWLEFAFPIMVESDLIEVLEILLDLGIKDERMQETMDIILNKQNNDGSWILERSHIGRYQTNFEPIGKPSKWITLRALRTIKKYYST